MRFTQAFNFIGIIRLLVIILSISIAYAQYSSPQDSIAALIKTDKEDTNKITHLSRLGWELMYSNPDTSIILAKQAEQLALKILDSDKADSDQDLSTATKKRLGQVYNCLGVFYWFKSDYATSIFYHQRALTIRRILGDRKQEGVSLSNLGLVYKAKGDFNQALKNYFAALSIAIEFNDLGSIPTALSNLGTVYHDLGEHRRAMDFYFASMPFYKKEGDMVGLSMAYAYSANAYVEMNDLNNALKYFEIAISISREIDNFYLESFQLNNTGEVYMKQNRVVEGLDCFNKALPMAEQIGDLALVSTILMNIGEAYVQMNEPGDAKPYLEKALKISMDIEAYPNVELAAKHLSALYSKTGNFELAFQTQEVYISAHDSIYNQSKTKEFGKLETKHELTLEARERQRAEEERLRTLKAQRDRVVLLQMSGIILLGALVAVIIMVLGFRKVNLKLANAITFFATLLLFEFCLVLLDPVIDQLSNGLPAYKLLLNAFIALLIFPIHTLVVRLLKKKLTR